MMFASKMALVTRVAWSFLAAYGATCAICWTTEQGTLRAQSQDTVACLPYAQFKIPFSVESVGMEPSHVQLCVSTNAGETWQMHGMVPSDSKHFDFRAAADGLYWFRVHVIDANGASFPSPRPPLRVLVDTTKPRTSVQMGLNSQGQLVIEAHVREHNLEAKSAILRIRSNQDSQWHDLAVDLVEDEVGIYHGQVIVNVAACREIAVVFTVQDQAGNEGQATSKFSFPLPAVVEPELTLASTIQQGRPTLVTSAAQWQSLPAPTQIAIFTRNSLGTSEVELRDVAVGNFATIDAGLVQYATIMSQAIPRLYPLCDVQVIACQEGLIVRGNATSEADAKKILTLVRTTSLMPVVDELRSNRR